MPFFASRSHIFTVPPSLPAITNSSPASNATLDTALVCPDKLCNDTIKEGKGKGKGGGKGEGKGGRRRGKGGRRRGKQANIP